MIAVKNLLLRSLSGLIYAAIILAGIGFGGWSFVVVFGSIVVLCLCEFYQLINRRPSVSVRPAVNCLAGAYFFVVTFFCVRAETFYFEVYLPYVLYILYVLIIELYLKRPDPLQNWAFAFLGQLYIVFPLSTLSALSTIGLGTGVQTDFPVLLLALFVFIWMNDTGAYLVGITCGKHRLFERISPKKSWEGFIGGAVFAILFSLIFAHYVADIPTTHWICMAIVTVVFATWGDLVESLLKRSLGVKDSGRMIPGHGGILDRFDSALLAAPALTCCHYILRLC
jgi:phosphatidate cytidylyltransferase